jgi:hypothetical protein
LNAQPESFISRDMWVSKELKWWRGEWPHTVCEMFKDADFVSQLELVSSKFAAAVSLWDQEIQRLHNLRRLDSKFRAIGASKSDCVSQR